MRILSLLLTFATCQPSPAEEKTVVATGGWSEPVNGLRGRLILARGRTLGESAIRESLVYVDLENVASTASGEVTVPFDPDALKCGLTGTDEKAVAPTPMAGSGGKPGKSRVTIPYDSSVRLRANRFAFGRAEGFLIPLNDTGWHIVDDADYFLSGTLTVPAVDGNGPGTTPWSGELKLPKAKVSLKKASWSEPKDGLVARLRLEKDDGLRSVKVLPEVNNPGAFGSGIAFPGEPQVELSAFEDGKPLKATFAAASIARAADPVIAVIAGGSKAEFRIDRVSAKTGRAGYLLLGDQAWELEPGKTYTVKGKVVAKAKGPKGWSGPLELPTVVFAP